MTKNKAEMIRTKLLEKGWKSATAGLISKMSIKEAFDTIIEYCGIIDQQN